MVNLLLKRKEKKWTSIYPNSVRVVAAQNEAGIIVPKHQNKKKRRTRSEEKIREAKHVETFS